MKQRERDTTEKPVLRNTRPRCGKLPHGGAGSSDHAVAEYYTKVWERPLAGHVAVNYTKMALEEQATEPQPEEQVVEEKRRCDLWQLFSI